MEIKSYKSVAHVAISVCRLYKCEHLKNGKCMNSDKEQCPMEKNISTVSSKKLVVNGKEYLAIDYMKKNCKYRLYNGEFAFNKSENHNCYMMSIVRWINTQEKEAKEIENLHKKINETKEWDISYAKKMGYDKMADYNHCPCYGCPNYNHHVGCMKYSSKEICKADELCKEYNLEPSFDNWNYANSRKESERRENLMRMNYSGNIGDFYASASIRGGWCGD